METSIKEIFARTFPISEVNDLSEFESRLLSDLHKDTMSLFVEFFARRMGERVKRTKVVVLDKEEAEHDNIRRFLPDARILLCQFHAVEAFKRKKDLESRGAAVALFKRALYAKTEGRFLSIVGRLINLGPETKVTSVFNNCIFPSVLLP